MTEQTSAIRFHNVTNNTGLIFKKTDTVSIPNAHKIMKINLNLTHFNIESMILQANIDNITDICKTEKTNPNCNYFEQYIKHNSNRFMERKKKSISTNKSKTKCIYIYENNIFLGTLCMYKSNKIYRKYTGYN